MRIVGFSGRWALLALGLFLAFGCGKSTLPQRDVLVGAAASLRGVFPALAQGYAARHAGVHVSATFGASGDLRRQVEGRAPMDAVLLASGSPVDELIREGLVRAETRRIVAQNQLVLIGPKGGKALSFATLDEAPSGERIAIGDPATVPAGQYAREALEKLGKWKAIEPRLVLAGDVSAVLAYVRRGEVAAGVVYRTELRGIDDVVVLDTAKGNWAPRPEVVGAVVTGAKNADDATEFLSFIASRDGQKLLADFGFGPP